MRSTAVVGRLAAVTLVLAAASGVLLANGAPEAAAATENVTISNYRYSPNPLNVRVGDTVTWTNLDDAPHTVTTSSGPTTLGSPQLSKGQSWSYTFTTAGTYLYYCTVHPDMKAEVQVAAAPAQAAAAPAAAPGVTTTAVPAHGALPHATAPTSPAAAPTSHPGQTAVPAATAPPTTGLAAPTPTLVTTTSSTSPGSLRLNPLLFLLAVVVAVVAACALGIRRSPPRGDVPEADVPEANVPKADGHEADVPEADGHEADVPAANSPSADAPSADAPSADVPTQH